MVSYTGMDAAQALVAFAIAHGTQLPQHQREFLSDTLAGSDMLRKVIVGMEVLYASRVDAGFPAEGITLLRDIAQFVQAHNFYGMGGLDGRATRIVAVAQRLADGGAAEDDGDVAPSTEYAAPTPTVEPAAPETPSN